MSDHRRLTKRPRSWDDRVLTVEQLAQTPGFIALREEIIALARLGPDDRVLDLGAGTGLLALAAAPHVREVIAVDVSAPMCEHLQARVASLGVDNVHVSVANATQLPLADGSVDVVISNYCLHHLPDGDKHVALREIARVLRPGGRVVIGDMMFRIGLASPRDRAIIGRIVRSLLHRGPAGALRLLRNGLRLVSGRSEHPANVDWWRAALTQAGFEQVSARTLEHEGGIAIGRRPESPRPGPLPGADADPADSRNQVGAAPVAPRN